MNVTFDQEQLPDNIYDLVFPNKQHNEVARMLIEEMKANRNEIGEAEMHLFAKELQEGKLVKPAETHMPASVPVKSRAPLIFTSNQFQDNILTPLKSMGLIDHDQHTKSYRLSDKFNKNMMRIGLLWSKELRRTSVR